MLNLADIAFLCLPDKAAIEAVSLIENTNTAVIDTSTAHRTSEGWAYGFAELSKAHREAIRTSKRVANPGCHASGFISTVYPLVAGGVVPADFPLTAYSLTGYSGGGKSLIAEYEDANRDPRHDSHRIYGTTLAHKHLPEMQKLCGLAQKPVFSPILGDFYAGMATTILLPGFDAAKVWECLSDHYAGEKLVSVAPLGGDEGVIYASTFAEKDIIAERIDEYNSGVSEEDQISYTDYVALLMSSITTIINAISYVLIAFVAISLVVSSIMIGIITYISVLERTKEIGILRAIGASKRDISRVFNAETLIVGFVAGAIGIGMTLLLIIPINAIVHHLTGIPSLSAILPPAAGAILVVISMVLTFIAGLVPSGIAARKDPVEALRTE